MSDDKATTDRAGGAPTMPKPDRGPGLLRSIAHRLAGDADVLPVEGHLPSFEGATSWLNSKPLTPEGLSGRVVLVDFWTYTCINWLRTAPYVKAWDAKYRDLGLTVIGVHTPEFGFEQNIDNVVARSRSFGVDYPIAVDSNYGVWEAFANHFWPAIYIADAVGRIRYHHFGEGEYAMTEMVVQQLLFEAGVEGVDPELASVEPEGFEVAADWQTLRTPETYVGYGRSASFASPDSAQFNKPHIYPAPSELRLNEWAPSGAWTLAQHAAVSNETGARIAFRFQARDVNLVMGPAARGTKVPFRVLLDGKAPGDSHGFDVDEGGNGSLADQRLYQLIRQPDPIRERLVEIEFLGAGAEAYCFTFG
ncbi:MAG TPA: thioredoxin [Candidatus Dormibacteraeota bacterium]|nr:thioredoxin [Candidatus Dormibacteraeota bacterium]